MTGAEVLLKALEEVGVEVIFGFPGGAVLPIYDALYNNGKIKHVRTVHEQGAAHAADGYARATGRVGVVMSTSGPGATNLVTGIATAYMDSVPMVVLAGQVSTDLIGRDSFQEVDICGITLPITKHSFMLRDKREIVKTVKQAFHIARSGRPGPVVIELPKDVMAASTSMEEQKLDPDLCFKAHSERTNCCQWEEGLKEAAELIRQAERPVIYAGGGVKLSGASSVLLELAEKVHSPVATTLMGIGCFPQGHELYLGMLGMHGTPWANLAVSECDLLVAVGARFDDRVTGKADEFARNAKIIHIDIDSAEIGKNVRADLALTGDAKEVLSRLVGMVLEKRHDDWLKRIKQFKEKYTAKDLKGRLTPRYVMEEISRLTGGRAIIATEVGQHQMWAAQYYKFEDSSNFITSGGLGTMGFGLPAAIGAKIGRPDKIVFDIAGDGSFEMNCHELLTALRYDVPVIVVVFNNRSLGMVRQWQDMFYGGRFSHSSLGEGTDYSKIAQGFGVAGYRAESCEELRKALKKAMDSEKPAVIEVLIDKDEKVLPIVPPGKPIYHMLGID
nr:MAG: biosynthetic-type acetolactate synthase large subunit [Bacillota bacterium]